MENNETRLLKAVEVACLIGSSVQTITSWYRWRDLHPEHEMAKRLPDYVRIGNKNTRFWKQSDIWKLIEFKQNIKQGRNGLMGDVTQMYVGKKHKKES